MYKRNITRNNKAVSTVIETIVIVGIITISIGTVTIVSLPNI